MDAMSKPPSRPGPRSKAAPPLSRRRAAPPPAVAEKHDEPVHEPPPPFSRLVDVRSLPAPGVEVTVEANAAERAALARLFGAPEVARLVGVYRLKPGSRGQVMATGTARATLTRACVLTLDPFEESVEEPVDVVFAPDAGAAHRALTTGRSGSEAEVDLAALSSVDPPDPIVDGRIDLGALTAEFVALGLDPYPRKPGAVFQGAGDDGDEQGPFAALGGLAKGDEPGGG